MTNTTKQQGQIQEDLGDVARKLEKLAIFGMDTAKKLGADAAKIATSTSVQKRLVVENKQFTLANTLASRSIGILVHKDQKKGSASVNTVTEDSIKQAVTSAMALAQYSVPDENLTLATVAEAPPAPALPGLYEDALAAMQLEEMQDVMVEVLAPLTAETRLALERYEFGVSISYHAIASTTGMRQSERQTTASWSFMGMGRTADQVTGFDYDSNFSYSKAQILPKTQACADEFLRKIMSLLNPVQCPSYKGPVLLSPRAVAELITGMILYHAGGRQVMDGKSRWDKSVGTRVVSDKLTISDHPHDTTFSGATAFDGDGVPTKDLTIVDQGVLRLHLHDCYSAKRCKTTTSGTSGGPFSMRVAAGTTPLAQILKDHKQLLLVDRFSGNSDPIKGDFSGVAKSSRFYSAGVDQGSVTETMIAGNFFALADAILAVTKESEVISGGFMSPYILLDGVSVTGGGQR